MLSKPTPTERRAARAKASKQRHVVSMPVRVMPAAISGDHAKQLADFIRANRHAITGR